MVPQAKMQKQNLPGHNSSCKKSLFVRKKRLHLAAKVWLESILVHSRGVSFTCILKY